MCYGRYNYVLQRMCYKTTYMCNTKDQHDQQQHEYQQELIYLGLCSWQSVIGFLIMLITITIWLAKQIMSSYSRLIERQRYTWSTNVLHALLIWTISPFLAIYFSTYFQKERVFFVVGCSPQQYLLDSLQHWLSCVSCLSMPIPELRWLRHWIWKQWTFHEYLESTAHLGWKQSALSCGLTHDII